MTTTITRARVYVDTRAGATKEAGDIVQPIAAGVLKAEDIVADLHELARDQKPGRQTADEITLFKSVGAALEDLAAGIAVYEALKPSLIAMASASERRGIPAVAPMRSPCQKRPNRPETTFLEAPA